MNKKLWFEIPAECSLNDGLKSLLISGSRLVIINSNSGSVLGILTEGDLLRAISDNLQQIDSIKLEEIANKNFLYVSSHRQFEENIKKFITAAVLYIPVINKNRKLIDVIDINEWLSQKLVF